jgi:hypothetical protein
MTRRKQGLTIKLNSSNQLTKFFQMKRALQNFVTQINHYKRVTRQNGFVGLAMNTFKN